MLLYKCNFTLKLVLLQYFSASPCSLTILGVLLYIYISRICNRQHTFFVFTKQSKHLEILKQRPFGFLLQSFSKSCIVIVPLAEEIGYLFLELELFFS